MHAAIPKKRTYCRVLRTRLNLGELRTYQPLLAVVVEFLQLMSTSLRTGCVPLVFNEVALRACSPATPRLLWH